ncbi:chromate efflux transporter [Methylotuvimicrobium sp.]|uniref:chromate efflux transporter n=1 Tax=Methylotuvimicrobium sp. TaxID=2822413 RepID=UPI003D64A1AF
MNKNIDTIPFKQALWYWFKLGFISFGGPAGQISMMHQELVEKRKWISEHRFLHALNYCMVLPGPEAQQLATYIGWLMHGVSGGIAAGVLFVLPSLFILIALTWSYLVFNEVPAVSGILYGIKPAVTAIIVFAAYRIGSRALSNRYLKLIATLSFFAIFALNIPFPLIVLGAGILGWLGAHYFPNQFHISEHPVNSIISHGPAVIDDHTPMPVHAKFTWSKIYKTGLTGFGIWASLIIVLLINFGRHSLLTHMAWFFTKAALLTFGGAYAVLPYVYQGGVEHFSWLNGTQMMDGLALGETTPGPLIMVVAFVGFVGGWNHPVFEPDSLAWSGIAAASIATLFTFLPSFLFILIGGPLVEATRDDLKLTAPLKGITAAVVGVILNLAVFFAWHVLWPQNLNGSFDPFSALTGIAAFLLLLKFKRGIVTVIGLSAILGLLYSLSITN